MSQEKETHIKREVTDKFPCSKCGGNMEFDVKSQALVCPYCSYKMEIENKTFKVMEYDLESAEGMAPKDWGEEKRVIHCENCGAETVLGINNTAQFCAFCGSSHIIKEDKNAGIVPETLIPFKITKKNAEENFVNWIKGRFFAPNALKKSYQNQRISGVYLPFWTYDTDTCSTYTAEGGTYYYETELEWIEEQGENKQVEKEVRKVKWWPTSGSYSNFFDDILVNASKQVDSGIIKGIEPFKLEELIEYKPEFLSGFIAERYSIVVKEAWNNAKEIIDKEINSGVTKKINADEVRNLNINTIYNDIKFKHILLPVWISAYNYKGKIYKYMINGQTGKVDGEAPISPWKVTAAIIISIIVISIVYHMFKK